MTRRLRPWPLLMLALVLVACRPAEDPNSPGAPEPEVIATPQPVDRLALEGRKALLGAAVPLGLLRVAPVDPDAPGPVTLGHARRGEGMDLRLTVQTPGQGTATDGAIRWSSQPGRLVGAQASTGLLVEATAAERVALYRISVAPGTPVELLVQWTGASAGALDTARGRRAVTGGVVTPAGAQLHAALRFDLDYLSPEPVPARGNGPEAGTGGLRLSFRPPDGVLHLRVALSTVDLAGARANLADLESWDFEAAHDDARGRWNAWLGRLEILDDTALADELRTDWYQVIGHYGGLTDRNARYRAPDGEVRRAPVGRRVIGNLDLARESATVIPLLSLLAPELASDLLDTMLLHQRVTGQLPGRTHWGFDAGMAREPVALEVLAGLAARGIPGAAAERILPPMLKEAATLGRVRAEQGAGGVGYLPFDRFDGPSVSETLATSHADHAVAVLAVGLGNREIAAEYATRSLFYRLLYDESSGWFRGRNTQRAWRDPFTPPDLAGTDAFEDYDRGGPWAALWWPARFDVDGWLGLLGGRQVLAERLDDYFAGPELDALDSSGIPGEAGSVATLPVSLFHVPWLYAFSNDPGRTPYILAEALDTSGGYAARDVALAAWRLFAGLGFYPVLNDSGEYVLAAPQVAEARLELADGFLTVAGASPEASPGARSRLAIDGVEITSPTVSHRQLATGGDYRVLEP